MTNSQLQECAFYSRAQSNPEDRQKSGHHLLIFYIIVEMEKQIISQEEVRDRQMVAKWRKWPVGGGPSLQSLS